MNGPGHFRIPQRDPMKDPLKHPVKYPPPHAPTLWDVGGQPFEGPK